jgi:hypothetical protein
MKKSGILLLASAALLLASCGTKYTLKGSDDATLTLGGSSFTLVEDEGKIVKTVKGKAVNNQPGQYKLIITEEAYQLEKGETLTAVEEGLLGFGWSSDDIELLKDGKKVSKKLSEDKYYTVKIAVDEEAKTYSLVLF